MHRPLFQHDGLSCGHPLEAARRDPAGRLADVLRDGDVGVMSVEDVAQPERMPHLAEAGIDIKEDAPAGRRQDFLVVQEPHHVDERGGRSHALDQLLARQADRAMPPSQTTAKSRSRPIRRITSAR